MKKQVLKNDKRGWDCHAKKVVLYAYIGEDGCVYRANGVCVGNTEAGDFTTSVPEDVVHLKSLLKNRDAYIETLEKQINMKTETKKPVRVLDAPANHNLQDCLQELKAGRKAKDQLFLQKMIDELKAYK